MRGAPRHIATRSEVRGRTQIVCAAHAEAPWAVGEPTPASRVEAELLSVYGVEVLPVEVLEQAGHGRSGDLLTRFLRAWDTRER